MNRATAAEASDQAAAEGMAPLMQWVKSLVDDVIAQEFASPDLEFRWKDDRAGDPATVASIATDYVKNGIKSVNEVRGELGPRSRRRRRAADDPDRAGAGGALTTTSSALHHREGRNDPAALLADRQDR